MISIPDWLFYALILPALLGYWALLGGLFHLIDWIHPNKVMKWCRINLVDAELKQGSSKAKVFGDKPE